MSQKMRDDVADEVKVEAEAISSAPSSSGDRPFCSHEGCSTIEPDVSPQTVVFPGLLRDRIRTAVSFAVQLLSARQRQALLKSFQFSPDVAAFLNESDRYHTNGLASFKEMGREEVDLVANDATNRQDSPLVEVSGDARPIVDALPLDAGPLDDGAEFDQSEVEALRALRGYTPRD